VRDKAWRRKQEVRKKKKVVREYYNWWGDWDSKSIGLKSHTPCRCSCYMCGNPRHHYKAKTLQELKNESENRTIQEESCFPYSH